MHACVLHRTGEPVALFPSTNNKAGITSHHNSNLFNASQWCLDLARIVMKVSLELLLDSTLPHCFKVLHARLMHAKLSNRSE